MANDESFISYEEFYALDESVQEIIKNALKLDTRMKTTNNQREHWITKFNQLKKERNDE